MRNMIKPLLLIIALSVLGILLSEYAADRTRTGYRLERDDGILEEFTDYRLMDPGSGKPADIAEVFSLLRGQEATLDSDTGTLIYDPAVLSPYIPNLERMQWLEKSGASLDICYLSRQNEEVILTYSPTGLLVQTIYDTATDKCYVCDFTAQEGRIYHDFRLGGNVSRW